VRFTQRAGTLYALLLGRPTGGSITLRDVELPAGARARLVGGAVLAAVRQGTDLVLSIPGPLPDEPAHAVALEGAAG
jgi:hypothetical protein